MKHADFWQGEQGLVNIKPQRIGEQWESFDAVGVVKRLCDDHATWNGYYPVIDVGCGTGRMCQAFHPAMYGGFDLNLDAIFIAHDKYPAWMFSPLSDYRELPRTHTLLLHSAALHIPDDELPQIFAVAHNKIVIGEVMLGSRKQEPTPKEGLAFHYSRSPLDYISMMPEGFRHILTETHYDENSRRTFTYMVMKK